MPARSGSTATTIRVTATCSVPGATPASSEGPASGEQGLGNALDVRGFDLAFVALHDVADQPAELLDVRDAERGQALADERPQRVVVEPAREEPLAIRDLEAKLGGLGGPALARLLELDQRLLELLAVRPDDIEHERIVDRAGEALGRSPLGEPRLDHPHDVGGAEILVLDRGLERVVEGLLESHRTRVHDRPVTPKARRCASAAA